MSELSIWQLRRQVRMVRRSLHNMPKWDPRSPQLLAMQQTLTELCTQLQQARQRRVGLFGKCFAAACRNAGLPMPDD